MKMYNSQEMDRIESVEETQERNIAKEEDSLESGSETDTEVSESNVKETKKLGLKPLRVDSNNKTDLKDDKNVPGHIMGNNVKNTTDKALVNSEGINKGTPKEPNNKTQAVKHLETDVDAIENMEPVHNRTKPLLEGMNNAREADNNKVGNLKEIGIKDGNLKSGKKAKEIDPKEAPKKDPKKILKERPSSGVKKNKDKVRYADDMKDISELLTQVKEDVVTGSANPDSGVYIIEDNLYKAPSVLSPNLNPASNMEHRTFLQLKSGFIQSSYDKSNILDFDEKELCRRSPHFSLALTSPLDIAIALQRCFQQMTTVCHGLLGGVALFQLILVYFIESPDSSPRLSTLPYSPLHIFNRHDNPSWQDDMEGMNPSAGMYPSYPPRSLSILSYASLAFLPPAVTILLLLLCIVSVLDRYDISSNLSSWSHLVHLASFRKSVIVVPLYLVSLLLTLICYKYDEMFVYLSNYPHDLNFAKNLKANDLLTWKQLTAARCLLSLLAWIILALNDPQDLLQHNLKSIKNYETSGEKETKLEKNQTP